MKDTNAMKLFHWPNAKSLELYSTGDIIVMAPTIEEARSVALKAAETAYLGYTDMVETARWIATYPDDADDQETFRTKLKEVEQDLRVEPVVYDVPTALFINGSA